MRVLAPLALLAALGAVATVLTFGGSQAESTLGAVADLNQFNAGNIISDQVFFFGSGLNVDQIAAFISSKGANCVTGDDGTPCLKVFTQNTTTRPADAYCNGYAGAAWEPAAVIIAKVAVSCNINPKVLLVMLEKERGLIRASGPSLTEGDYRIAMGYGCPDTAACDTQYYGFQNQVYMAAWQMQKYAKNPGNYTYRAGRTVNIQWHPNAACGSAPVYIENQATAGLYNYTPYQPNAAALAAGYGQGNSCSAYGNRNFWLYFTDWFGSTQSVGGNAVVSRAAAASWLGAATSPVICGLRNGGCFQAFANGSVYWSPGTNAQIVKGDIGRHWAETGWETGRLGYPTGEEVCGLAQGGCFQSFANGSMYWTPGTGAHTVLGAIYTKWKAQRWETGALGYPTADESCNLTNGGCRQTYQGGTIYWSQATGARTVFPGAVADRWTSLQREKGLLGYPTNDTVCGLADSGCFQTFSGGAIYSSAAEGAHVVRGEIRTKWAALKWETGDLGYPSRDTDCGLAGGACFQTFQGGSVYWSSATGAHTVTGEVLTAWAARGYELGSLGFPTGDTTCDLADAGCSGEFQRGSVYWTTATGARVVSGSILTRWTKTGAEDGALGYPTGEQDCRLVRGGCFQQFEDGLVYATPSTGTRVVSGAFFDEWAAHSWEVGPLGYPAGEKSCGLRDSGCFQLFEGGMIYSATAPGTHTVLGDIWRAWAAQGWESGLLGYPTTNETCSNGVCTQQFQGGSIVWSAGTGARIARGAIGTYWTTAGGVGGPLGLPAGDPFCGLARGGCYQVFQNGSVYWTAAYGAHAVSGPIRTFWGANGWEVGSLGYPKADAVTSGTQTTQVFEGGTLVLNRTTGAVTRR